MFELGWGEILLCLALAFLVAGPGDVPRLMRHVGVFLGRLRRWGRSLEGALDRFIADAEAQAALEKEQQSHPASGSDGAPVEEDEAEFHPPEREGDGA